MSQIESLEIRGKDLKEQIYKLKEEREGLIEFKQENANAIAEVEMQLQQKCNVADKFFELKTVSTFAERLAEKVAECYGGANGSRLLEAYSSIDDNIAYAIQKIEQEISQKEQEVCAIQLKIEQMGDEESV